MRYILCTALLLIAAASSSYSSSSSAQAPAFTTIAENLDVFSLTQLNGNQMIFAGSEDDGGSEPWVTDGSPQGTFQILDVLPGPDGSCENCNATGVFVVVDEVAYFVADDGMNGFGLWRTDGTAPGTSLVQLLVLPPNIFFVTSFAVNGDALFIGGQIREPGTFSMISEPFFQVVV